jgi:hypothetical protein
VSKHSHALALAVTYTDNRALDAASLDSSDVRLVGPDGERMSVTLLGIAPGPAGSTVATYGATPADGSWRRADGGEYTLVLEPGQVKDVDGAANAGTNLAAFQLEVVKPRKAPAVRAVKLRGGRGSPHRLTVRFTSDASPGPAVDALVLTPEGGVAIDPARLSVSYDPRSRTATWTFPGLEGGVLPEGRYALTLRAARVTTLLGQHLDGDLDRAGPDDFVLDRALVSRRL